MARDDLNINMQDIEAFKKCTALFKYSLHLREDIIMIGAQLCAKLQLRPSELLGEENATKRQERFYNGLTNEMNIVLSRKKSARK